MTQYQTPRETLERRLKRPSGNLLNIQTDLAHFALINYALPKSRLEPHIPTDRFEIPEFIINGQPQAMLSVVPFLDTDFRYHRLAPWLKFQFGQTNHRVYVIDKQTGEHVVWFFGTTLGSPLVYAARTLWRIPWHFARYEIDCHFDQSAKQYIHYRYQVESDWCSATISLEDTGESISCLDGFETLDEMKLILTHPVAGYFYRLDETIGTYSIWHPEMSLTVGRAKNLYFSLYERLGILSREEMQHPHSIFICPNIGFEIYLPPRRI